MGRVAIVRKNRGTYVHVRRTTYATAVAAIALLALAPHNAEAQRRIGAPVGFYTTTGLPTLDVEGGSVTSTTELTESPRFAISALATRAFVKQAKRAYIVGLRGTALSLGNGNRCNGTGGGSECRSRRFTERVALLAGGAFDIRSTVLRAMAGPVVYGVESSPMRVGTQVRLDYSGPRLSGSSPTLFVTRSFLGSVRGQGAGITTLGAGLRWVRKGDGN